MLLYQIGQCGNQIGLEFWSELLKLPIGLGRSPAAASESSTSPIGAPGWDLNSDGFGICASDWHMVRTPYPHHDAWYPLRRLFMHDDGSARGIVVDSEPKVVEHVGSTLDALGRSAGARSGGVFRQGSLIAEQCGRGNNWALGYYGGSISKLRGLPLQEREAATTEGTSHLPEIHGDYDVSDSDLDDDDETALDKRRWCRRGESGQLGETSTQLSEYDGEESKVYFPHAHQEPSRQDSLSNRRQLRERARIATHIRRSRTKVPRVWIHGRPKDGVYAPQTKTINSNPKSSSPSHRPDFTLDTISSDDRALTNPADFSNITGTTAVSGPGQSRLGLFMEGVDSRSLSCRSLEAMRQHLERMDYVTGVCFMHALSGGTGSGLGSRLTEEARDLLGAKPLMLHIAVSPFRAGEIALQHYNCALTLATLQEYSDAIWLASNEDIFTALSLGLHSMAPGSTSQASGILSPFASANRYVASSLLDFLSPTLLNPGLGSNVGNAWGDPALQLTASLANVCPIPGAKLFEIWNSAGLVYNSPTPTIPQISPSTTSLQTSGSTSTGALFNGSWSHHLSMLTRCVPKSLAWSVDAPGVHTPQLSLLTEAKRDAVGTALGDLRSELTFPNENSWDEGASADELLRASASPTSGDATVFQKTLCAQAAYHGCKFSSTSSASASGVPYGHDARQMPKAPALRCMDTTESADIERAHATLTRLFPTPNWISQQSCLLEPGRYGLGGVSATLSPASSLASFVAVTGPAVYAAIQQQRGEASFAVPLSGRALTSAQSIAIGTIRRRLAGTALESGTTTSSSIAQDTLGRTVSFAVNRGRSAQALAQTVTRCAEMLSVRAYVHWFERCGCSTQDIAEAAETVNQIVDNYRCLLR